MEWAKTGECSILPQVMKHACYNIICSVHFVECDVIIKDEWVKMWDEAEEVLGGKIEILCNNAGVPRLVG